MTAEEARKLAGVHYEKITPDLYSSIDATIKESASNGKHQCVFYLNGFGKPWEQIYKERDLIKKHYEELGFLVRCFGYNRACMQDEYGISWQTIRT